MGLPIQGGSASTELLKPLQRQESENNIVYMYICTSEETKKIGGREPQQCLEDLHHEKKKKESKIEKDLLNILLKSKTIPQLLDLLNNIDSNLVEEGKEKQAIQSDEDNSTKSNQYPGDSFSKSGCLCRESSSVDSNIHVVEEGKEKEDGDVQSGEQDETVSADCHGESFSKSDFLRSESPSVDSIMVKEGKEQEYKDRGGDNSMKSIQCPGGDAEDKGKENGIQEEEEKKGAPEDGMNDSSEAVIKHGNQPEEEEQDEMEPNEMEKDVGAVMDDGDDIEDLINTADRPMKQNRKKRKALKKKKHPLQCGTFKVKSATNETSGNGNEPTCHQGNQPSTDHSQVSTCPSVKALRSKKDEDDDDGEGRKNHSTAFEKRLGCDRPAPEKKRPIIKGTEDVQKEYASSTPKPHADEEFDWGKTGARPKVMPISAPTGDVERQFQPSLSQDDEDSHANREQKLIQEEIAPPPRGATLAEEVPGDEPIQKEIVQKPRAPPLSRSEFPGEPIQKVTMQKPSAPLPRGAILAEEFQGTKPHSVLTKMEQLSLQGSGDDDDGNQVNMGPAGDNAPMKHFIDNPVHCQSPRNAVPHNHQNLEAVRRLYQDNGSRTGASVLPGRQPRPNEGRDILESDIPEGLGEGPREVREEGGVRCRESPVKLDPEGAAGRAVIHGTDRDLKLLVERIRHHNHEGPQEDQDGVLLTKELFIKNGSYREGRQYNKLMFLGHGSFGDVYLIQDVGTKKNVVGKRVPLEKFAPNEAILWCDLEHPNILRLLGLVRTGDMVFFLSEYRPGSRTLQELIKEGVLGQGRSLAFFEQLLEALVFLHRKKIVHKDVKPDNILVDGNDRIRLLDFGVARKLPPYPIITADPEGTECYMAPEIARSDLYNEKVDVWSGFCTLICEISGHPPWFQRFKAASLKFFIIGTAPAPLQDIPANTDPRVRDLIESGLQTDMHQRPSASQVLESFPHDLVEELYDVRAISQEPDLAPIGTFGMPNEVLNQPFTPCTPRGPQEDDFCPFHCPNLSDPNDSSLDISLFYLTPETADDKRDNIQSSSPSVDRELPRELEAEIDMYGPSPEVITDVDIALTADKFGLHSIDPEVHSLDQHQDQPALGHFGQPTDNGQQNVDHIGQLADNLAVNFSPQVSNVLVDVKQPPFLRVSPANSQAALSFIQDEAEDENVPANLTSESFELDDPSEAGIASSGTCSVRTALENLAEALNFPSDEGAPQNRGANGRMKTSGFESSSPKCFAEDFDSTENKLERSSYASSGINVVIDIGASDPIRMKISLDMSAYQVAEVISPRVKVTPFTLTESGKAIRPGQTFSCGEHILKAVQAKDGGNWLWRMDDNGQFTPS